jgi:transcriptional regulator with XRE-family HTH domain
MAKRRKLGDIWKDAREKQLKLRQFEMASKLEISPAYLSLIESGQRPTPSLRLMRRMAKLTGLTVSQLSGEI